MVAKSVLIMLAIILVLFLVVIFVRQKQEKKQQKWPPVISKCPDYFTHVGNNQCMNTFKLTGSCRSGSEATGCDYCNSLRSTDTTTIDFLKGKNLDNEKEREEVCQMIGKCGLSWEGVSDKCAV